MTEKPVPDFTFQNLIFNPAYYDNEINNNITKYEANNEFLKKPINQSTGLVNSVLTLTNTTTKEMQWTTPTVVNDYVRYTPSTYELSRVLNDTPTTITSLTVNSALGRSTTQRFGLPANCSTAPAGAVLSILTASGTAPSTQWISLPSAITNYTNYNNTNKTLISNVSGTPTTITDLVMSSSVGSSTAEKFVLPSNSSTAINNSVLTINSTTKATSWSIIPTQITEYVQYNTSTNKISNIDSNGTTIINDLVLSNKIGSLKNQMFKLPTNISSSFIGATIRILDNTTDPITTEWETTPQAFNPYVSYNSTSKQLEDNGALGSSNITDLVVSSSIGSSIAQKFVLPSNSSTSTVGQVLSILNATSKTTQWITIPTQISDYVRFNPTTNDLSRVLNGSASTITLLTVSTLGSNTSQRFALPTNSSTAPADYVLSINVAGINNGGAPSTIWKIIPPQISNYTNYDNTAKTLISNVSGTPTTITDLVISSSLGSSTAQKFVLPSNSSTCTVGQVLSILDATTKTTQWITIPTQISTYVDYNIFTGVLIYKSLSPATNINTIVIDDIGKSGQTFTLPTNTSTSTAGQVLSILNATSKTTQWITPTQITNYVNYSNPNLISNVSGTPSTISDLTISGNIKSNSYDSSVADTGIITIGGGTSRTGDINIGTAKNTSSAQLIRIGSNDINAIGQEIRFSRPIQPPAIIQLSDRDMGYTSTNLTAITATYASGTVSLSIPATNFFSNGNYMFKCSLTISSTTTKVLTSIKFGLNKTNAPAGYVSNCFTDISINTGTAAIFTNKTYQLSSFFRYLGTYSFDYIITFTGIGTLNVVSSIDFIRLS